MHKSLYIIAGLVVAHATHGASFLLNFTGSFNTGPLTGEAISAFIEIEDNGLLSGTADTNPLTLNDGDFLDFGIEFDDGISLIFFDLLDDPDPLADFDSGQIVGIDYLGENFDGDFLDVFYDAFASNPSSGISVEYEPFGGALSTGTLNLPVNVPEPQTYALLVGMLGLTATAMRRRRS